MDRPLQSIATDVLKDFIAGADRLGIKKLVKGALVSMDSEGKNCFCAVGVAAFQRLLPDQQMFELSNQKIHEVLYESVPGGFKGYVVLGGGEILSALYNFNDHGAAESEVPETEEERYVRVRAAVEAELKIRAVEKTNTVLREALTDPDLAQPHGCEYVNTDYGVRRCIVGTVLHRLGVPDAAMFCTDASNRQDIVSRTDLHEVIESNGLDLAALRTAQSAWDSTSFVRTMEFVNTLNAQGS